MKPLLNRIQGVFNYHDESELWEIISLEAVPLCKGKIGHLQFWKNVSKKVNKEIPDNLLEDLWVKDYEKLTSIDKGVEKTVILLKKNYKLAMISNTIEKHVKINRKLGRFKLFDVVIFSNEVGSTKGEKDIFLLAIEKLNVQSEECVFVDDIKKFLEIPKKLGMKTIHFKNSKQLVEDLRKLGLDF